MEFLASLAIKALIGTSICGTVSVAAVFKYDRTLLGFKDNAQKLPTSSNANRGGEATTPVTDANETEKSKKPGADIDETPVVVTGETGVPTGTDEKGKSGSDKGETEVSTGESRTVTKETKEDEVTDTNKAAGDKESPKGDTAASLGDDEEAVNENKAIIKSEKQSGDDEDNGRKQGDTSAGMQSPTTPLPSVQV